MAKEAKTNEILARNVRALRAYFEVHPELDSVTARLKRTGLNPKSLNNVEKARHNATLETLQRVADMFQVDLWQLFLPDFKADEAFNQELRSVIRNYAHADPKGRAAIYHVAELSASPKVTGKS